MTITIALPIRPPSSLPISGNTSQSAPTEPSEIDWGDFKWGAMRIGQGRAETLVQSLTERGLTIRRFENAVVEMDLNLPDIEHLVLSGGGAKGVAFSGMVKALEVE